MDITIILNVKVLISIRYDINISGAAFCTVINSAQFSHLNPSITLGIISGGVLLHFLTGEGYK